MRRSSRILLSACVFMVSLIMAQRICAMAEPDELMPGSIAVVKPAKLAKFVAKPVALFNLPDSSNDPTVNGGTLHLFDTVARPNGDYSFPLPAGGNWKVLGSPTNVKGYKYRGAGTPGDPCKVVLIKQRVVKAVCKGADIAFTLPFQGDLGVVLTVGNAKQYCAVFGGAPKGDAAQIFKRKAAPPPAMCPNNIAAPTPTDSPTVTLVPTATATETTTQTATGTSTPTPPFCGDAIAPACNGVCPIGTCSHNIEVDNCECQ